MRNSFFDENGKYKRDNNNVVRTNGSSPPRNNVSYLGNMAAEGEWRQNKELAKHMFLHTEAYHEFLLDSSLILLGRTGIGKTAIILSATEAMIENVSNEKGNSVVFNIDSTELLINLSNCIELTTLNQTTALLEIERIIQMFVETAIMQEIIQKTKSNGSIKQIRQQREFSNFLEASGFIKQSSWTRFISTFLDELENVNCDNDKLMIAKQMATSISRIVNKLKTKGFDDAKEELIEYLNQNGRAIVLIDSLDQYNVNNKELVLIVKGLIQTCFHYYNNQNYNILLKIALPSEIYNKVLVRLPAKQSGNTVVIRWKYKELITFIALRIFAKYKSEIYIFFPFCEQFDDYSAFYADINQQAYDNSIKLISNFLPEICPTSLNFPFLTLPYCLRHTLKKPREVLNLFNVIIDYIVKNNSIEYFINNPDNIKDAIHKTQEYMISSALSMYASTYISIYAACQSLLHEKYFVFKGREINNDIKKAVIDAKKAEEQLRTTSEHMDSTNNCSLDESELKRILIESGLVGKISKGSTINENNPKIGNKEKICILSADFEFNVSATIVNFMFVDNAQYVFHPMCYENYYFLLDKNTLVYPDGDDDSDTLINTIVSSEH